MAVPRRHGENRPGAGQGICQSLHIIRIEKAIGINLHHEGRHAQILQHRRSPTASAPDIVSNEGLIDDKV